MITAYEYSCSGATTDLLKSYDSTKANLGLTIRKLTDSNGLTFIGPMPIGIVRPNEIAAIPGMMPAVVVASTGIDWVFVADNAAAAATRRVSLYQYNKINGTYSYNGSVLLNLPGTVGNHTVRSLAAYRYLDSTGIISVSGTSVVGNGTRFVTNRHAIGGRLGLGSSNPDLVSSWYSVTGIASDTSATLVSSAGTGFITSGNYVYEEIRLVLLTTNATPAQGGLFLTKGLGYDTFSPSVFSVPSGNATDNLRATYKLSDFNTTSLQSGCGLDIDDPSDWLNHDCYVLNSNGTTTSKYYKFNLRAALTPNSGFLGQDTANAFQFATGSGTTLGNISLLNNSLLATARHGNGSGIKCLYFCTNTRVYRCPLSDITLNGTSYLADFMVEIPPGGTSSLPATSALSYIDIDEDRDAFVILTTGATAFRHYVTKYKTDGSQFDELFGIDAKYTLQSLADSDIPYFITTGSNPSTCWVENGICHFCVHNVASTYNQMLAFPLSAHYNDDGAFITPKFTLNNPVNLRKLYTIRDRLVGNETFGVPTESFTVYYRTAGIDDNTGTWVQVPDGGNLNGIAPTNIQFKYLFKILGMTCVPSKIYTICLTYDDSNTDSHYNPSASKSSATSRVFAWRQASSWGGTIPDLRVKIINADTAISIIDDTVTSSAFGVWQYSTDGTTWNTWSAAADAIGNYIRYTANSLPDGVTVKAIVIQA